MPDAMQVQAMFGRIAPRYDLLNGLLSLGLDLRWRERTVERSGLKPGMRALDLCAGTGALSAMLASTGAEVQGLDFSSPMLEDARARYPYSDFPNLQFVEGDALHLPFESATFDVVTMAFGLRNLEDVDAGVQEMRRVLKPGGKALILELTRAYEKPWSWFCGPYLKLVVPALGSLVSGDREAYRYLSKSIAGFMPVWRMQTLLEQHGFINVEAEPQNGGVATLMIGIAA